VQVNIDGRLVEVAEPRCKDLACLRVGHFTHHSAAGASGCSSWTDPHLSCLTRDAHGCPPYEKRRFAARHAPDCTGPRYAWRLRRGGLNRVRCLGCNRLIVREAAFVEQQEGRARGG
jgi:hypothetical protein